MEIARRIYAKTGYVLVVCGTEHDVPTIERFLAEIPEIPQYNLLGKTSVQELIEVVGRTRLLVTNDTSIYHIGVAQKRKVCVVTGRYIFDMLIINMLNRDIRILLLYAMRVHASIVIITVYIR